jgi:hypothetical protein
VFKPVLQVPPHLADEPRIHGERGIEFIGFVCLKECAAQRVAGEIHDRAIGHVHGGARGPVAQHHAQVGDRLLK